MWVGLGILMPPLFAGKNDAPKSHTWTTWRAESFEPEKQIAFLSFKIFQRNQRETVKSGSNSIIDYF